MMDDATFDAHKQRIQGRVDYWAVRLGLGQWDRVVDYHRERFAEEDQYKHPNGYGTPMTMTSDWRYRQLRLDVYVPQFCSETDLDEPAESDLDRMIIHEFIHPTMAPLRRFVKDKREDDHQDQEELAVSSLACSIAAIYDEGYRWNTRQQRKVKRLRREVSRLRRKLKAHRG